MGHTEAPSAASISNKACNLPTLHVPKLLIEDRCISRGFAPHYDVEGRIDQQRSGQKFETAFGRCSVAVSTSPVTAAASPRL